ncbi:hypothetical protein [Lysinibacillus yapensis]|uniref:hypothetical protein n=1 Tax=Ureibacillus yapensis TaxID=2304605 RepID=UPI0013146A2F|nr:hypothetical protein [Lysinibacillus yapensis]
MGKGIAEVERTMPIWSELAVRVEACSGLNGRFKAVVEASSNVEFGAGLTENTRLGSI